ncbi:MAG: sce7726 family protein [Myxococcales bacterium]|nr:sce7726 family protein [Myxococcales bacterium]
MSTREIVLRDADIRPALRSSLLGKHADEADTVIVEELGVCRGRVRVDLAVVNGTLHGYEIKSDRDSLRRLEGQVDIYSKVLDRATLIASARHLDEATELLPSWWGVQRVELGARGMPRFRVVRRERKNPSRDARALVELLWLDDALALLEEHGAARGVRGKPRWAVWDRVCEVLDIDVIAGAVRATLKATAKRRGTPRSG